mgnify:CR=1 FL=1
MPDNTPLAYQATKGGIWVTVSSGWQLLFGFVANIILTRLLLPSAFGEFVLAIFFAQLITVHQKIGLGRAFVQNSDSSGKAVGTFIGLEVLSVLTGTLLMVCLAYILPRFGYSSTIVAICGALFISLAIEGIGGIGCVFLEKEIFLKDVSLLRSITFPLSYIPAFWGALHGAGPWSIVLQHITNSTLFFVGSYFLAYRRLPHLFSQRWEFDKTLASKYLRFGAIVGATFTAGMLFMKLDSFFIGTFVGVTILGYYDRAYNTAQWPGTFSSVVLSRSVFFVYSRLQGDRERLMKTASIVTWLVTTFSLPLGLMMFITAPNLIALLYGETWLPSSRFLRILIIYTALRPLHENAAILLTAVGKPQLATRFSVLQLFFLMTLGFSFTLMWGAMGTSVAVVIAFLPGLVLAYYDISKNIPFRPLSTIVLPMGLCLFIGIAYVVVYPLTALDKWPLITQFLAKTLYAFGAFFSLLTLLQPKVTRERLLYLTTLIKQSLTPVSK